MLPRSPAVWCAGTRAAGGYILVCSVEHVSYTLENKVRPLTYYLQCQHCRFLQKWNCSPFWSFVRAGEEKHSNKGLLDTCRIAHLITGQDPAAHMNQWEIPTSVKWLHCLKLNGKNLWQSRIQLNHSWGGLAVLDHFWIRVVDSQASNYLALVS